MKHLIIQLYLRPKYSSQAHYQSLSVSAPPLEQVSQPYTPTTKIVFCIS
jgi:hypothetical protein